MRRECWLLYHLAHDCTCGKVVLVVHGLGLGLARLKDYRILLDAGRLEPFA